jgi:exopolysaccharide biosynthesis protein
MPAKHALKMSLLIVLLVCSLLACDVLPSVSFNGTPVTAPQQAGGSSTLDAWTTTQSGVEIRREMWKGASGNSDTVTITRFDPKKVKISIGYQPETPLTLKAWMKQTKAIAVINGGFFNSQNQATALLVTNGQAYGTSYQDCCGMFSVDSQGQATIQSLADQPYDPNTQQLEQAVQCRPMLIENSKRTQFEETADSSPRSIIAMDTQGRLLFIVSPSPAFSLDETADLLQQSDLQLKTALNLDGGSSTGLYFNSGGQQVSLDPVSALPIVIIVK